MAKAKTVKTYQWEYCNEGSMVVCYDNSFHKDGQVAAMCRDEETAECITQIMNESRKSENVLK